MSTSMDEARQMAQEEERVREVGYEPKDFKCYACGLCNASICTTLSAEEAVKRMNEESPTEIESQWQLSKEKTFENGYPNPCHCPDFPTTHMHYLLEC
jgi:hypothetical protein